jgi:hypothetical protein
MTQKEGECRHVGENLIIGMYSTVEWMYLPLDKGGGVNACLYLQRERGNSINCRTRLEGAHYVLIKQPKIKSIF